MSAEGIESSEKDDDDTDDNKGGAYAEASGKKTLEKKGEGDGHVDGGKELESVFDEGDGDEVGATRSHMGLIAGDKILMYPARKIKFGKVQFNPFAGVFNNFTGNIASKFVDDFGGGGGFGAKIVSFL